MARLRMATHRLPTRPALALAWGAGAFVAVQLVLAVGLLTWWPTLRDPWYGLKLRQLRVRLAAAPANTSIVMLGSSRTLNAFNAALVERRLCERVGAPAAVYNFGLPGVSSLAELVLLRRLLADGVRPDLLLVEVSPSFMTRPVDLGMFQADRLWHRELSLLAGHLGESEARCAQWWRGRWLPCHTHREAILYSISPKLMAKESFGPWFKEFDSAGWERFDAQRFGAEFRRGALAHTRRELTQELASGRVSDACRGALIELVESCRDERIALVLVVPPVESAFQVDHGLATASEVTALLDGIRRTYAVAIVDARGWAADDEIFDSYHVLASGANAFSERLVRDELVPQCSRIEAARRQNASARMR